MTRCLLSVFIMICTANADDRLYVVQSLDESLARINLQTGDLNAHAVTLDAYCNDITHAVGSLFVTTGTSLQEISPESNTLIRDLALPGCASPWTCAAINADTLIVTCWSSDNAALLRLSDGEVVGHIAAGNGPEGILVHGERVFIAATNFLGTSYGAGSVLVYDRSTLLRTDSLAVGTNPQSMAVDNLGRLHVVCTGNYFDVPGQIDVFDLTTMQHLATVATGGTPAAVSFAASTAYLAAGGWGNAGHVLSYSLENLAAIHADGNPISVGRGATDIEANSDQDFFVSCFESDVVEHRGSDGSLMGTYLLADGPGYMVRVNELNALDPQGNVIADNYGLLAFPNPFNGTIRLTWLSPAEIYHYISIYNSLGQVVERIPIMAGARSVDWSPASGTGSVLSAGSYFALRDGPLSARAIQLKYIK